MYLSCAIITRPQDYKTLTTSPDSSHQINYASSDLEYYNYGFAETEKIIYNMRRVVNNLTSHI